MTLQMTGNDRLGSPLMSFSSSTRTVFSWGPFGGAPARSGTALSLPGFNGERQDPLSGATHLGNGYRAYSPALRRFTCPDSESPFGIGGINPYVYCDNDPINRVDPGGHGLITWLIRKTLRLAVRLGMKVEQEEAMSSNLTTAGAVETGTEVSTQVATGVAKDVQEKKGHPKTAQKLGWASMAMGIAGAFGLFDNDIRHTVKKLRSSSKTYRVSAAEKRGFQDEAPGHFRMLNESEMNPISGEGSHPSVSTLQGVNTESLEDATESARQQSPLNQTELPSSSGGNAPYNGEFSGAGNRESTAQSAHGHEESVPHGPHSLEERPRISENGREGQQGSFRRQGSGRLRSELIPSPRAGNAADSSVAGRMLMSNGRYINSRNLNVLFQVGGPIVPATHGILFYYKSTRSK